MNYQNYENPTINPRNASDILDAAVSQAYQLSAGNLRNFTPGSPFMVLLESLIFAHVEFLHWCENLPDAILYTLFSKALGVGISIGTYSETNVTVTLSQPLNSNFVIPYGSALVSNKDDNKLYEITSNLEIPIGSIVGSAIAKAVTIGSNQSVVANELSSFEANFAFILNVTNTVSTAGSDPDSPADAQAKIQALLSQRNPSSAEDWINIAEVFFGVGRIIRVTQETPNITLYIKDLVVGDPAIGLFNAEALRQRNLLQEVFVLPFKSIPVELKIRYSDEVPSDSEAIRITEELNSFITDFKGEPQPIDLYEKFTEITGNTNLAGFDLHSYELGVLLFDGALREYTWSTNQVIRDNLGQYYIGTANSHFINSPFDEAELSLLKYYPVIEFFGGGYVEEGYIVKFAGDYYLTLVSGAFQIPNAQLLPPSVTWEHDTAYTASTFIKTPSPVNSYSHGFTPKTPYTSSADATVTGLAPLTLTSRVIGESVSAGQYWYFKSRPNTVYLATVAATVTSAYLAAITAIDIDDYPRRRLIDHWLTNTSVHRVGLLDLAKDFVTINDKGDTKAIPPTINTRLMQSYKPSYGTLFKEGDTIYEFKSTVLAGGGASSTTIPSARATREQDDFTFITYPGDTPYYLEIAEVQIYRGLSQIPEKSVTRVSGVYQIVGA